MTEQQTNDLVFRTKGEETLRIDGNGPWPGTETPSIIFHVKDTKEIARFTEEGFYYKGEFIEDAGQVHEKMKLVLDEMQNQAWMTLCERLIQAVDSGNKDAEDLVLCQIRTALKDQNA